MPALPRAWIALALAASLAGCLNPKERRPGLRLTGEVAAELPADWSFANEHREIAIEVRTPYLVRHSVTIWCSAEDGELYVGARNPDEKRWVGFVARNPNVRLRIGGRVYEATLSRIDDPEQLAAVRRAYAAKYDLPATPAPGGPPMRYWRVVPRS